MGIISSVGQCAHNIAESGYTLVKTAAAITSAGSEAGYMAGHMFGFSVVNAVASVTGILAGIGEGVYNCRNEEEFKTLDEYVIGNIKKHRKSATNKLNKPLFNNYEVSLKNIFGVVGTVAITGGIASCAGLSGFALVAIQLIHAPACYPALEEFISSIGDCSDFTECYV